MCKRKVLHGSGFLLMACAIVAAANCAAHGTIDTGTPKATTKASPPRTVLVFCDRTPGSFFWADTWQRVAERSGEQLTMTTTLEEFFSQLNSKQWSSVKLLAKWSAGEPAFAAPLMAYANANPRQHIMMFLWHDNGVQLAPDTAVSASVAIVTWQNCKSTIGYALVDSAVPKAAEAKTSPGLLLPDFQSIHTEAPVVVGPVSEGPSGRIMAVVIGPCEVACYNTLVSDQAVCQQNHQADMAQCAALYGPGDEGDPGDPEAYASCMGDANAADTACLTAAAQRHKRCIALCKKLNPAPPAEPVP